MFPAANFHSEKWLCFTVFREDLDLNRRKTVYRFIHKLQFGVVTYVASVDDGKLLAIWTLSFPNAEKDGPSRL